MKEDGPAGQAKNLIEKEFDAPSKLVQSLGMTGVSRRHLNELFEARYGMSMQEYVNKVRLERSQEMLRDGLSVTETAFSVGMSSPASFAKFFRKSAGMTPSYFIQNGLEAGPVCYYSSPVGVIKIGEDEQGISSLRFADDAGNVNSAKGAKSLYLEEAVRQLEEYFAGKRKAFDLPLSFRGSEFQRKVWTELRTIPYGETRSYQDIAEQTGSRKAARAVGMAANKNPLLILIPCHRLVGKDNRLVGYAGGLERKQYLLDMEKRNNMA